MILTPNAAVFSYLNSVVAMKSNRGDCQLSLRTVHVLEELVCDPRVEFSQFSDYKVYFDRKV